MPQLRKVADRRLRYPAAVAEHLVHLVIGGIAVDGDYVLFLCFQLFQRPGRDLSDDDEPVRAVLAVAVKALDKGCQLVAASSRH